MTETLASFLTILAWWQWLIVWPDPQVSDGATCPPVGQPGTVEGPSNSQVRRLASRWLSLAMLGLVFGISILARPTAAPWVGLLAVGLLGFGCRCWKRRILDFLIVLLLVSCCIGPWTMRNYATFGKPIWATTHGGYTLLLANNPLLFAHFAGNGPSRNWDAEAFHAAWAGRARADQPFSPTDREYWFADQPATTSTLPLDEVSDDRLAYSAAWATIGRQPGIFFLSCLYRMGWFLALWPNDGPSLVRLAIGLWYAIVFALAAIGLLRGVRRIGLGSWLLPLALFVTLTIIHAIYWSNMRMRAPLMAMFYVAAAEVLCPAALFRNSVSPMAICEDALDSEQ